MCSSDLGEDVEVLAHSQGAEACSEWMADYADKPDAPDPAKVSFILLGNPRRRLGGAGKTGWNWKPIPRTPETQYRVVDVSRRWDGWANNDNWPGKPGRDSWRLWLGRWVDHTNYDDVDLGTCQVRERSGNTTYLVSPT